jgi:hypothetical protein
MNNIVKASVIFCFKGESHSPSITLELDKYLEINASIPDLYPLIAKANNHDLYSYEYEMMQAENIVFSDAEGLVADFVIDGRLDMAGFQAAWQESVLLNQLQEIAQRIMSVDDIQQQAELKQALIEAYQLGVKSN